MLAAPLEVTMTKAEAVKRFKSEVLGSTPPGDQPALDQAWNDWTDMLCKSGEITLRQYENWVHPKISKAEWVRARGEYHRRSNRD